MRKEGSKTERKQGRISNQIAHNITKHTTESTLQAQQQLLKPRGREISFSEAIESNSGIINETLRSNRLGGPKEHFIQKVNHPPSQINKNQQNNWPWENDIWSSKNIDWDNPYNQKPFLREKFHNAKNYNQGVQSSSRNSKSSQNLVRRRHSNSLSHIDSEFQTEKFKKTPNFNDEYNEIQKRGSNSRRVPSFRAKKSNSSQEVRRWKERMAANRMTQDIGSDTESFMNSFVSHNRNHKPPVVFSLSSLKDKGKKKKDKGEQEGYYVRLEEAGDSYQSYRASNQCRDLESRTTDFTLSDYSTKKGFFKNQGKSKITEWEYHNDKPKNTVSKYSRPGGIKQMILESQNSLTVYTAQVDNPKIYNNTGINEKISKNSQFDKFNIHTSKTLQKQDFENKNYKRTQNLNVRNQRKMEYKNERTQKRSRERKKKKDRGNINSNPIESYSPSAIDLPLTSVSLFIKDLQKLLQKGRVKSNRNKEERPILMRESSLLRKQRKEKRGAKVKVDLNFNKNSKRENKTGHDESKPKLDPSILNFSQEPAPLIGYLVSPKHNHAQLGPSQHSQNRFEQSGNRHATQNQTHFNTQNQNKTHRKNSQANQQSLDYSKNIEMGRVVSAVSEEDFGFSRRNIHSDTEDVFYLTKNQNDSSLSKHNKFLRRKKNQKTESNISINYGSKKDNGVRNQRGGSLAVKKPVVVRGRESHSLKQRRRRPTDSELENGEQKAKRERNRSPMRASSQLKFGDEVNTKKNQKKRKISHQNRPHNEMIKKSIDLLDHKRTENLNVSLTDSFLRKKEVSDISLDFRPKPEATLQTELENQLASITEEKVESDKKLIEARKKITNLQKELVEAQKKSHRQTQPALENEKMRHEISNLKENLEMEKRENRLNNDKIRVLEIELAEERKIIKRERSDNTERESKLQKSQLDMIEKLNERNKEMAHLETKLKKQEKQVRDSELIINQLREEMKLLKQGKVQADEKETQIQKEQKQVEQLQKEKYERENLQKNSEISRLKSDLQHLSSENLKMRGSVDRNRREVEILLNQRNENENMIDQYAQRIRDLEHLLSKNQQKLKISESSQKFYVCNTCKVELETFKRERNQNVAKSNQPQEIESSYNIRKSCEKHNTINFKGGSTKFGNDQTDFNQNQQTEQNIFQSLTPKPNTIVSHSQNNFINNKENENTQNRFEKTNTSKYNSPKKIKTQNYHREKNLTPSRNLKDQQKDSNYKTYSSASKPQLTRVFVNNKLVYDKNSNFEDREMSQDLSLFGDESKPKRRVLLDSLPAGKISLQNIMRASREHDIQRKNRFGVSSQSLLSNNLRKRDLSHEQTSLYQKNNQSRNLSLQPQTRIIRKSESKPVISRIRLNRGNESSPGPYHVRKNYKPVNQKLIQQGKENQTSVSPKRVQKSQSSEPLNGFRRVIKRTNITPKYQQPKTNNNPNYYQRDRVNNPERASDYYYVRSNSETQPNPTNINEHHNNNHAAQNNLPMKVSKVKDVLNQIKYNIENNNVPVSSSTDDKYVVSNLQSFTNQNGTSVEEFSKSMHPDPTSIQVFNLQTSSQQNNSKQINTQITIPNEKSPYNQKPTQTLYNPERSSNYKGNTLYSINTTNSNSHLDPYYSDFPLEARLQQKKYQSNLKSSGSVQRITQRKPMKGFKRTESGFLDQSLSHNQNIEADFENFTKKLKNKQIEKSEQKIRDNKENNHSGQKEFHQSEVYKLLESEKFY